MEINGGETLYDYQANRLISTTGQMALTFAYDQHGNTIAENAKTFIYNQNQRLKKVVEGETTKGEYIYNGKGQRAKKAVDGQSTLFFYDAQGRLIAETGATSADYLYLNGYSIAKADGTSLYFYHRDHLGTPQRMTDVDKTIVWAAEFKPFGEAIGFTGTIVNNLRFPGQYFDAETGLSQNYFRDYMPHIGRYIEADPVGLRGGPNLFTYVQNKPLNNIDQYGLLSSSPASSSTCDFYDKMCEKSRKCGPYDRYACITKKCCQAFGDGLVPDCIRGCLYKWETSKCSAYAGDEKKKCRRIEHWDCYTRCNGDILGAYYLLFPKKECVDSMNEVGGMMPW